MVSQCSPFSISGSYDPVNIYILLVENMITPQVIRTKIIPPRKSTRVLVRPRITHGQSEALHHRLTLVQSGAGYGKSTAQSSLAAGDRPLIWYQVTREDGDPLVFLQHLNHATQLALPES